jgi:thiol-disulfide isomerase/thioredoxin
MRKILFIALLGSLGAIRSQAQGIDFYHGTWSEALAKAKSEGKIIFVDAYAEWCGPCKRMAAQVFTDSKAGDFYNPNFVNLKIDMEKPENAEFAGKFPVSAYPTLMFIDAEGKLSSKQVGALNVDQLLEFGRKALGGSDKSKEMTERYEGGERDPQFLFDYVRALNRAGKPSLKITNEYLATQKDLSTPFNQRFILEGASEADSRVFDLLIQNREGITKLESATIVNNRIEKACLATVRKAIEFKDQNLLNEAKNKMKQHYPEKAAQFAADADIKYATATSNPKAYLKSMKAKKKQIGSNAARTHDLVIEMLRAFPEDPKVLKQAESWAAASAKAGGMPEYYLTLADIYKRQGKKDKARKAVEAGRKAIGDSDAKGFGAKFDNFLKSL